MEVISYLILLAVLMFAYYAGAVAGTLRSEQKINDLKRKVEELEHCNSFQFVTLAHEKSSK